ncbi:hypothetical protein QR680_004675 [Steinernema hermaphroditum]|uniref:Abnormal cell migration protein 18-like fibronectin type I domain-containing protein n=1 Tax=Steinernema hermaphroditum TaxID=289476 RepID=A0AA39HQL5_9BILA|nr:hypothetical protein QR680_004675 [Steinernema hermaphroditum]
MLLFLILSVVLPFALQSDTFPTVDKCQFGKHYVINHVVFNCSGAALIRTYKPVGCTIVNDRKGQRLNIGQVHNGFGFVYLCHREGSAVEYKPIRCLLNEVEMESGMRLRRNNVEYECMKDPEGPMKLKQVFTFHNFCHPGQNGTLSQKKCEGQSSHFIHSAYGIGKPVSVDILRDTVIN